MKNVATPMDSVMRPLLSMISESEPDDISNDLLHQEEPSPTSLAVNSTQVKDAVRQEASDNATHVRRHPEKRKSDGELGLRVIVYARNK